MINFKSLQHTCGMLQLYFCKNLFDSVRDNKITDDEFLTKKQ